MRRLVAVLACALAGLSVGAPASAVVGGTETTIDQVPWQVAVLPDGYLCGGSIVDATHVVTAAHCTFDELGMPYAASKLTVVAASTRYDGASAGSQVRGVAAVTRHPSYDDGSLVGHLPTNDAAVLTLSTALVLTAPGAAPVALGDRDRLALWDGAFGDTALVSGWGVTESGTISRTVRRATVPVLPDADCRRRWGSAYSASAMLCGSTDEVDTCQGDSGGPAVVLDDERPFLAGITSFGGSECADASAPGVYTEVAAVRTFVEPTTSPPQRILDPGLTGTARSGELLTCGHGRWTGSPALGFAFVRTDVSPAVLLPGDGTRRYRLRAEDAGTTVACRVTAANAAGNAIATSASTAQVEAAPVAPAPEPEPQQPTPTPEPEPLPQQPAPAPPPSVRPPAPDRARPTSRTRRVRCTRTHCTFRVVASDPRPSSGLRSVAVRLLTALPVACPQGAPRTRCTRTVVTLLRTRGTARARTVTVRRPRRGSATLVAVAQDVAGNRQRRPARVGVPPRRGR